MSETTDTELRELLAAGTQLPWKSEDIERVRDGETTWDIDGPYGGWVAHTGYRSDAELIATAVNALPGLLDRVERADRKLVAIAEQAVDWEGMPDRLHQLAGRRLRSLLQEGE